ncbi:MAG: DNA-processing protein DprA [Chitinophagaceae bacterium]
MLQNELLYLVALSMVPTIGDVHTKTLLQYFPNAESIFKARKSALERIPGIGTVRASSIRNFRNFERAEKELRFLEKYKINALAVKDNAYPKRLLHCYDAPPLLYFKGNGQLNASRMLSIVGTREPTDYGRDWLKKLITDLAPFEPTIVSGLAYGIDSLAHKQSLKSIVPTIGVLAHGLDRIYPAVNKSLAREMLEQGGLLTDFMSGTQPDAQNFPSRNRIVAGISDAVIVVETGNKGGSMITADIANSYNKDVFALPGRVTDNKSEGCNKLIKENNAQLISGADDIITALNWDNMPLPAKKIQRMLFPEISLEERKILDIIGGQESVFIDTIYHMSGLKSSDTASAILNLELFGLVRVLPGKRYQVI